MPPRPTRARHRRPAIGLPSSYSPLFRVLRGPLVPSGRIYGPVVASIPPQADGPAADLQRLHRARGEVLLHHHQLPSLVELDDVPRHGAEVHDLVDPSG